MQAFKDSSGSKSGVPKATRRQARQKWGGHCQPASTRTPSAEAPTPGRVGRLEHRQSTRGRLTAPAARCGLRWRRSTWSLLTRRTRGLCRGSNRSTRPPARRNPAALQLAPARSVLLPRPAARVHMCSARCARPAPRRAAPTSAALLRRFALPPGARCSTTKAAPARHGHH